MSIRTWTLVLVSTTLIAACSADPTSPLAIGSVQLISGDGQAGTPGLPLNDTLTVEVLDQTGRSPMSGVPVTWTVTYSGATLSVPGQISDSTNTSTITYGVGALTTVTDTSDLAGRASVMLRLGPTPGTARVVATVADLPGATFSETGRGLQARQVTMGFERACAIDLQGRTWCWGVDRGDSTDLPGKSFTPALVVGGHHFLELAAGDEQTCGLEADESTWCWGTSTLGNLGSNTVDHQLYDYPIPLANAPAFNHISSGDGDLTCGTTADSTAYCWGANDVGQVGSGSSAVAVPDPALVAGGLKFISISPTYDHTCAIAAGGAAWCWGSNSYGQLGDSGASGAPSTVPVAVAGGHVFQTVATMDGYSCGLTRDTGPVCWGSVPDGTPSHSTPVPEPSLSRYAEFAPGGEASSAIIGPQAFSLWSFGDAVDALSPVYLHGLSGGYWAACALAQDGTVYCWGANTGGEQGNPDSFGYDLARAPVHAVIAPPNY
ncbi:MAG: RCC1 domain-containing protein [Gemmatimonadales bacterium]